MLAEFMSVMTNIANRTVDLDAKPPAKTPRPPPRTFASQFLPDWILVDRVPLDSAMRRYPYVPATAPQAASTVLAITNAIFDSWNASFEAGRGAR